MSNGDFAVILRHFISNMNSAYITMKATTKTDLFKSMDFSKCSGMDGFPNNITQFSGKVFPFS